MNQCHRTRPASPVSTQNGARGFPHSPGQGAGFGGSTHSMAAALSWLYPDGTYTVGLGVQGALALSFRGSGLRDYLTDITAFPARRVDLFASKNTTIRRLWFLRLSPDPLPRLLLPLSHTQWFPEKEQFLGCLSLVPKKPLFHSRTPSIDIWPHEGRGLSCTGQCCRPPAPHVGEAPRSTCLVPGSLSLDLGMQTWRM